jgi:hypothetical protein
MTLFQFAIVLLVQIALSFFVGESLMRFTGAGALANVGSQVIASFVAGLAAGAFGKHALSSSQLLGLAVLYSLALIAIGFGKGIAFSMLAVALMLVTYTLISYACLRIGAAAIRE